jgi:hypothetical protein
MDRKTMKTINFLILIVLLMAFALPADAQLPVSLTPRAGLNLATITPTGGSIRTGLNFGVSGEYAFTTRLATELGLYYSMQGTRFRSASLSPDHSYILVPLLAKYYLGNELFESSGLNFFAGPQLDIKALVNKVGYTKGNEGALLPLDMTKLVGMSVVAGVGFLFITGFMISGNVNIGLTNKANDYFPIEDGYIHRDKSYKNLVVQLNFGYRFKINN